MTILSTELELLLRVLAAPDDDEPRLVYADGLQEKGDPRGEFIPLQCALARPEARADPAQFAAMRAREGELLSAHADEWTALAIPFEGTATFRRGFVEDLFCLPGELLLRGLEVVAPIRALRLDGDTTPEVAQRVLSLPVGRGVRELSLRLRDGKVDPRLKATGAALQSVRQLSPEENTIEVLHQLGWLSRLKRLELPLSNEGAALIDDLGIFKPPKLEQLWLHRQGDQYGAGVRLAVGQLFTELPGLTVRWNGIDYRAANVDALVEQLTMVRRHLRGGLLNPAIPALMLPGAVEVDFPLQPPAAIRGPPLAPWATTNVIATPVMLIDPDPPPDEPPPLAMPVIPTPRAFPPADPWAGMVREQRCEPRGFMPRAVPKRVTMMRVVDTEGAPALMVIGPANNLGAKAFAEDVAQSTALRAPRLLRFVDSDSNDNYRIARSEPFEGVTLWELQRLSRRLDPGVALRVVCEIAQAGIELHRLVPAADDVLLDVHGQLKLLTGFPALRRFEEPKYEGNEERRLLGVPFEDLLGPGARIRQLGTVLYELLTGTALFDVTQRSTQVLERDWEQLQRWLDEGGPSLLGLDASLAPFEPLLRQALTRAESERFRGLPDLAEAIERMPERATAEQLGGVVRDALAKVPRTKDGLG
jgi:uncharacterized protein (TIGR02996 family)